MSVLRVEHALVMDTDHIPGRGGYALVSASAGVSQGERRFVADHLGVSDYLHNRTNARMYFSFFHVPGGRYAFVRRFANGTRRNGVQNRLFIHTLFLDGDAFDALHALPWLLADIPMRPEGAGDDAWTSLAKLIDPQQRDPVMPALEANKPTVEQAFASLQQRVKALGEFGDSEAEENIARAAAALARSPRVALPQQPAYELLTLLAWSVLPVADRAATAWTQHAECTAPGVDFRLVNAAEVDNASALGAEAPPVARRAVAMNAAAARTWVEYSEMTRLTNMRWGASDLESWLTYRDALLELAADPLAPDVVLLARLRAVARSVRPGSRDPWVIELTLLQFVWTSIMESIARGMPSGAAIERWRSLAVESGIGVVIFREPPSAEWLDASEAEVGADLVIQFFLRGSEHYGAAATRQAVAQWVLECLRRGTQISADALARLAVALALDRSKLLGEMLTALLRRADGFRALKSAIPVGDHNLNDGVLLAMLTGLQLEHRDSAFFAREVLLPQMARNRAMGAALPETTAIAIAEALRDDAQAFVEFAFLLADAALGPIVISTDRWVADDGRKWLPLARMLLQRGFAAGYGGSAFTRLAFTAAAQGEGSATWLPTILGAARAYDAAAQPATDAAFARKAAELAQVFAADSDAARGVLDAVRIQAEARIGTCMRALLDSTRAAWPRIRRKVAETVEAIVSSPQQRAAEWESHVLAAAEGGSGPLLAFWRRLGAYEIENLDRASIAAVARLRGDTRGEMAEIWTPRLRTLRLGANADALIATLRSIAPPAFNARLESAIALREIATGVDTPATYARLDLALQTDDPRRRLQNLVEAVEGRLRGISLGAQAQWLIELFAAPGTLMMTAQVIEDHLLPAVLRRLGATEWLIAIKGAEESVFAFDYFLMEIARRVAAAKAPDAVRYLMDRCVARGREAGVDALIVGSKGAWVPAAAAARAL
jgi:hypothetical protein